MEDRTDAWKFLCTALNLSGDEKYPPCDFETIELRHPRIDPRELQNITHTDTRKYIRILHAYGKSYRDLVRLRRGEVFNPPDAVIYPDNEDQIIRVIQYCTENNYTLIPFGGGSNLVGGVESRDRRIAIALDLKKMNRVLAVDEISQIATIEPGIWGPELESYLNSRGYTLGHFPQSFEYSTLGGWIATRGAGLAAIRFGNIDEMTLGLRMVTPSGLIQTRLTPAGAIGPSVLQILIGSEGTLGVITQATMRIHLLAQTVDYRAMVFRNFPDGLAAIREIFQSDLLPAMLQLSDEEETRRSFAFRKRSRGMKDFTETFEIRALQMLGYSYEQGALLMLGFEGDANTVGTVRSHVLGICQTYGAFDLGPDRARSWLADRYELPFLRDVLMDHGVMMDTLEIAASWSSLELLYKNVTQSIRQIIQEMGSRSLVLTHISHGCRDAATLHITFLAQITLHQEIEQWERIRRVATECVIEHGGTFSHHHGIGYEGAPWLKQEWGALGYDTLLSLKKRLDPKNIMNPGKLFLTPAK